MASYRFDENRRQRYLEALRKGARIGEAAKAVGVTRQQVYLYIQQNPEFAKQVEQAEIEACDPIEQALWTLCCTPGRDQLNAIKFWLQKRSRERWADVKIAEIVQAMPLSDARVQLEKMMNELNIK